MTLYLRECTPLKVAPRGVDTSPWYGVADVFRASHDFPPPGLKPGSSYGHHGYYVLVYVASVG